MNWSDCWRAKAMNMLAKLITGFLTYGVGAILAWLAARKIFISDEAAQWIKDSVPAAALVVASILVTAVGVLWTRYVKPWWDRWTGKTPAACLLILLLPLALGGCMAPAALREAEAWEVTTWQGHLGNDQRIEQCWEQVFVATRQADIEYTTQKSIDLVKAAAKTPADIEEGIKTVVAAREKAMADTQLVVAKMRGLVATNQNEAAKAMQIHGAVAEWMSVGMEASAIPNIVNEAFGLVQSLGLKVTLPGIQTPTFEPAPAAPSPAAVPK
jgi:hypothetical protein